MITTWVSHTCAPLFQELPGFFAKIKYQDMTADTNTVFQVIHKSTLPFFLWSLEKQGAAGNFNEYVLHRRKDQATCWNVYPIEKETKSVSPEDTVLVDIGSIVGHQCAELKVKIRRSVRGHVILQDHSGSIETALSTPAVENMVHDIFKPQPIESIVSYLS